MIVTISTSHQPASDLGYLLHKHPDRVQTFDVAAGEAHVFYPEATDDQCTAALLMEIDPIELVRARRFGTGKFQTLAHYVNDRPYAASSMLAVTLGKVFRSALQGRCDARPELVDQAIPLRISVPAVPSTGGTELVENLFAPLRWTVEAASVELDPEIPEWGESRYVDITLTGSLRLADALNHLYVLLPVLDNAKHYWVSHDEVDKLLRAGDGWLRTHPERDFITRRYLRHRRSLVTSATERLADVDDADGEALDNAVSKSDVVDGSAGAAEAPDVRTSLAEQRREAVLAELRAARAERVVDLGCGEGTLLRELLADTTFSEIVGVDVSPRALDNAGRTLELDRLHERQRERIRLLHSSLMYRDERIAGFDVAVLSEVIEHVDPPRLGTLERNVFGAASPATVIVTTPNAEFNVKYEALESGLHRHTDHRFEWTRAEFREWASRMADEYHYAVRYIPVGEEDPQLGAPTQMAVFSRDQALDAPIAPASGTDAASTEEAAA